MPRGAVPTVAELEARIDEAVVIARASEDGVREVGELAIDAAKQARRAAEAAEQSAKTAAEAAERRPEPAAAQGPRQIGFDTMVFTNISYFNKQLGLVIKLLLRFNSVFASY